MFSLEDLKAALRRRGPDSLRTKKVLLQSSGEKLSSFIEEDDDDTLCPGREDNNRAELHFIGAILQLRGTIPLVQPLFDASRNVLVYNGIFLCSCRLRF